MAEPVDQRPTPDPTVLTTEQLLREVDRVKELMEARLDGMEAHIDVRFTSIDTQLELVERQRVEQKSDTKAAVDAALTAQKEAVKEQTTASERAIAKSETATTKSIDQLGDKFTTAFDGVRRDIDELKNRVTGGERQKIGGQEAKASISSGVGLALGVLTLLVALLSIAVIVILANGGGP